MGEHVETWLPTAPWGLGNPTQQPSSGHAVIAPPSASSAPERTLAWLLLVLYATYGVQVLTGRFVGPLGASMAAAAMALPVCYAIQSRRSGPPVPVTFLPAFWLLVPGALGLSGVAQLVGADAAAGLGDFLNALVTIVAIAVGLLVGAGLSEGIGRATSTWRGTCPAAPASAWRSTPPHRGLTGAGAGRRVQLPDGYAAGELSSWGRDARTGTGRAWRPEVEDAP